MDWFGIVKETAQKVVEICKEDLIEISNTIPVLDAYADQAELYLEQSFNGLLYSFKKLDKNQQELYDISNSLRQPRALTEKQIAFNASFDPIAVAGIQANILSEIPQIKSVYHELVPSSMSHEEFWSSFFFHKSELDEKKRLLDLLVEKGPILDDTEDIGWGSDATSNNNDYNQDFSWTEDTQELGTAQESITTTENIIDEQNLSTAHSHLQNEPQNDNSQAQIAIPRSEIIHQTDSNAHDQIDMPRSAIIHQTDSNAHDAISSNDHLILESEASPKTSDDCHPTIIHPTPVDLDNINSESKISSDLSVNHANLDNTPIPTKSNRINSENSSIELISGDPDWDEWE